MIRSFLAINLPVRLVEKIRKVQVELKAAAAAAGMKVAWVPPTNLHVTLKFLGSIAEENAATIHDVLQPVLERLPAQELQVHGLGAFPAPDEPRVLWVGVHSESNALHGLVDRIEHELEQIGFPREKHPLHPHVTLGRVKQGAADLLSSLEEQRFGECSVHDVVLYKSELQRTGAEYTPLARFSLSGAPAPLKQPASDETPEADGQQDQ